MRKPIAVLISAVCVLFAGVGQALSDDAAQPARKKQASLPQHAIARLGTNLLMHGERVLDLAFSPDGTRIASVGFDKMVRVWDRDSGKELLTLEDRESRPESVAFSPSGNILASAGNPGTIHFWDPSTGKLLRTIDTKGRVRCIAFAPDGKSLASASTNRATPLSVWNVNTGQKIREWNAHKGATLDLAFSADGKFIATAGVRQDYRSKEEDDYAVAVWNANTGAIVHKFAKEARQGRCVAFSPDGKHIAAIGRGPLTIWNLEDGKKVRTFATGAVQIEFSGDGKTILAAAGGATLIDVETGTKRRISEESATCIAYGPDFKIAASAGQEGAIHLWDVQQHKPVLPAGEGHQGDVSYVTISPDGQTAVTGCRDSKTRLWELKTGKLLGVLEDISSPQRGAVRGLAFSPDGKLLATSYKYGTKIWDIAKAERIDLLVGNEGGVLRFTPDSKRLLTGRRSKEVWLWDLSSGFELRKFPHSERTTSVAVSRDGETIVSLTSALHVWQTKTGRLLNSMKRRRGCVAISHDGQMIAHALGVVELLDAKTGKKLGSFNFPRLAKAAAFSPDGKWIAIGGEREVHLARVPSGKHVATLSGHRRDVISVAFTPDGKYLVSGSADRTALVWDLSTFKAP